MSKTLRVFGCGGTGVNLVSRYFESEDQRGYAKLLPALIDTSDSNMRGNLKDKDVFLIQEKHTDGSGGVRGENIGLIGRNIKPILAQFPPGDFNLVVFSASGGSGSVIGPLLIAEMNRMGVPVLAIVVGSHDSVIAAKNTMRTIQTLENIAQRTTGVPVVMSYHQNSKETPRLMVDEEVRGIVSCMALLTSGENHGLDSTDLKHWVQYHKTTTLPARLSTMHVAVDRDMYNAVKQPISVASLFSHPDDHISGGNVGYVTTGYADLKASGYDEIHYMIGIDDMAVIAANLKHQVEVMERAAAERVLPDTILGEGSAESDVVL